MTMFYRFYRKFYYFLTKIVYSFMFGKIGNKSIVFKPMQVDNPKNIRIGSDCYISQGAWLYALNDRSLIINNGCRIGHFIHIVAMQSVIIEDNVLIADKVYISDCTHEYTDVERSIIQQGINFIGDVIIGSETWIGENVCIYGAKIGKHCVVGANSVINFDIPDYCVVVGAPAKIIKKYDFKNKKWVRV